jgi:hypothetical protein
VLSGEAAALTLRLQINPVIKLPNSSGSTGKPVAVKGV